MPQPQVSVIIVNHNGIAFIEDCLKSVLNSQYTNFEVILVDNGSTDGSLERAREAFGSEPRLRFVQNNASLGPAVGRNRGARVARGRYLIFLDNDTQVENEWIGGFVAVFENDSSIGAAQAKLLRMGSVEQYDCAGDYLGPLGFLIERSRGARDTGQLDFIADILSAKSAGSIIRRDLFERIGGFDEDYYMYLEETDLSWRVWLSGHRVVFVPNAVVYHAFNTPKKDFKRYYTKDIVRYYGCRNYITTLIKNLEFGNLIKMLPIHIACWIALSFFFALRGGLLDSFYILKGIGWNVLNLGTLLSKRKCINKNVRVVSDADLLNKIMDNKRINYYLGKAKAYLTGRPF